MWQAIKKFFSVPDVPMPRDDGYQCTCHSRMGNDFYFLPANECLRADRKCDYHPLNIEDRQYERPF